ncbi:transcriptional regulator [Paenibacillus elgii]|uniref:Transcriptional regulator n=1 Tax=Paenibacillus elgii TaxID=189691 RepID=A0A2T6FXC9_9BACL|nr:response regulator [Paenibacillus elgii]PUA36539.1 transcriptional regulator [Paenibacillus elgii]
MRFFIVDDDPAVRLMLTQIIEDEGLGQVVGEAEDGAKLDAQSIVMNQVDILFVDVLMPNRDGIETVRGLLPVFLGKIIMLSEVGSKDIVSRTYSLGIEYYVLKPINRIELIAIVKKVMESMLLETSIQAIRQSIDFLSPVDLNEKKIQRSGETTILACGNYLLSELGMTGESGTYDLLEMLEYLVQGESERTIKDEFPPLKDLFWYISLKKLEERSVDSELVQKEIKAAEQRVRRAISHALNHLASLGITDYTNPKFENYAVKFFDFMEVRKRMIELEEHRKSPANHKINTKKFVQVLYLEAKQMMATLN